MGEELLQICFWTTTGHSYRILAHASDTIGQVKVSMEKKYGIPAEQQHFLHSGRALNNEQNVKTTGLQDGQSLQFVGHTDKGHMIRSSPEGLLDPPAWSGSRLANMNRNGAILAVFVLCDADKDGYLNSNEMKHFATVSGFEGSDAEWIDSYIELCREVSQDPKIGISQESFAHLIDDKGINGLYCKTAYLRRCVAKLLSADRSSSISEDICIARGIADKTSREDLIQAVFQACDTNGDGLLCLEEMRSFAHYTGFEGSGKEWQAEFTLLRETAGFTGLNLAFFTQLVEDRSEFGLYCSDQDLRHMLPLLEERTCRALLGAAFRALDSDADGRLSEAQVLAFGMRLCLYCPSALDRWTQECARLREYGRGMSKVAFVQFARRDNLTKEALRKTLFALSAEEAMRQAPGSNGVKQIFRSQQKGAATGAWTTHAHRARSLSFGRRRSPRCIYWVAME